MLRNWKLASALLVLGLGLTGCPGPEEEDLSALLMSVTTRNLNDQGQTTDVRVTAMDAKGEPGTGTVVLKTPAGSFAGDTQEITLTLEGGRATTTYGCNRASDPACAGTVRLEATWGTLSASTSLQVGTATPPPADAGTDAGTGTGTDAGTKPDAGTGTDAGTDAGTNQLSLTSSKPEIFFNVGDSALLTATLKQGNNTPWASQQLEFDTTLGGLTDPAGGTPSNALTVTTGADGTAQVRFVETGSAGEASIRARHVESGQTATVAVKVNTVQQITHVSTRCNGAACTIMGVRGSGFNEQAQITFKVVDSASKPVSGLRVDFSIPNAPTDTTVTPFSTTNTTGEVTATISAGPTIGAVVVHAVAIPGKVEIDSPTIGIRGAKPANSGFSFKCALVNIGAHVSPDPSTAAPYEVSCTAKVVDRFNNPVGTGTTVNFKVEAGSIPNSIETTRYSPTTNNTTEGEGTVKFKTLGVYPPVDVEPLEAVANQFPFSRSAEPRANAGHLLRNPRDSLVTIIAYTRGEEYFSDDNSNGIHDLGEQFIDQGEPFVDSNDNGTRDEGETYIDEAPADNKWNGPNGKWDNDTSIWTETRILYTGRPGEKSLLMNKSQATYPPQATRYAEPCPAGLPVGGFVTVEIYAADEYFNRPQAAGTVLSGDNVSSRGSVQFPSTNIQDGYGFGIERRKVNAVDYTDCTRSTPVCIWRMLFYDWGYGYVGDVFMKGSTSPLSPPACSEDLLVITPTVLGIKSSISTPGALW